MTTNIYGMTDTWNDGGTTFTAIKMDVTDTASASGSLLMDLQVGGASRFSVTKGGNIRLGSSATKSAPNFAVSADTGLYVTGSIFGYTSGNYAVVEYNAGWKIYSGGNLGFTSGEANAALDTVLARDAANTLAQRNSTNAQTFNIYNTYTDASNYERGFMKWNSNVLEIGTEAAGTGTARALEFQTDGTTRMTLSATQNVLNFAGSLFGLKGVNGAIYVLAGNENNPSGGSAYISAGATSGGLELGTSNSTSFRLSGGNNTLAQFGGTTSSFPALKRNTTTLEARLADDSAYTNIQGKLTTETAYTAGAPTATGYIVLYDSTGTAYKVPAEAL